VATRHRAADDVVGAIAQREVRPSPRAVAPRGKRPVVRAQGNSDDPLGGLPIGVGGRARYLRLAMKTIDQIRVAPADVALKRVPAHRLVGC
jgi:hypothetical protein